MSDADIYHFGVKGMKWGVRKDRELKGRRRGRGDPNAPTKGQGLNSHWARTKLPKPSKEKRLEELTKNQKKFEAKFKGDSDEAPEGEGSSHHWRPTGKQIALCIVGAAAVGTFTYMYVKGDMRGKIREAQHFTNVSEFRANALSSQYRSWDGSGYVKPSSYLQKEFTLPAGHKFHRISQNTEFKFGFATYCVPSEADFNRYASAFTTELHSNNLKHVTFTAKKPIKVPDLNTRLDVLKTVLSESNPRKAYTDKDVVLEYNKLCGGKWREENLSGIYLKKLESLGYNAIIDDMDQGVIGDKPLVVFGKDAFSPKTNTRLTSKMMRTAARNLKDLPNRK